MNSDISSISSEEAPDTCRQLEESLGFKPIGTRNYMFSIFHRKSKFRSILFGGAYPMHIASHYIKEFYDHYIEYGDEKHVYFMSVILDTRNIHKETEVINLIKLEPSHKNSVRHNNIRKTIPRMFYIFTNIYKIYYLRDDERDWRSSSRQYRAKVGIAMFKESLKKFNKIKEDIREEYKFKQEDENEQQIVNTC